LGTAPCHALFRRIAACAPGLSGSRHAGRAGAGAYNPVNTALFRPDPAQREAILRALGIDQDAIVLGYFGRMHTGKGVFPLLDAANEAMAREPRLHCLWIGDGPDAQALREKAAACPASASRHHFVGWVDDTHAYYSAISMLAFPSIATETFGRVSIEAQAAGVPVLASDIGGVPETLQPGVTGLLLPPGRRAAWCEAILQLCDGGRRQAMAIAARDFVQANFSTAVIAEAFVQLLENGATQERPTADIRAVAPVSPAATGGAPRAAWRTSGMRRTHR
jgi:glycosyltransferase involved in cell wall biosynthesis